MITWLLGEGCFYIPIEGMVIVEGYKPQKLKGIPALLLNCLIEARIRKGSDILSKDEIAETIWGDHDGWDGSRNDALKKHQAIINNTLHNKNRMEVSGLGFKLINDIREYPEFLNTPKGQELFPSGDRFCFYADGEHDNHCDSIDYKYINCKGDHLNIVYSKPRGWNLLNLHYWGIELNKASVYSLAYGLRKKIIESVKLNKKTLEFKHMISYGLEHYDAFCFIQNSLFAMEEFTSYDEGKEQLIKHYKDFKEYCDNLYSKGEGNTYLVYLSQWYTAADLAEDKLLNKHDPEGLVILSWLYSIGLIECYNFHYPELVLLYTIHLRNEIERYFSYTVIDDFDQMIDDICDMFEYKDIVDIYFSKDKQEREKYINDIRTSYLLRQPLSFDYIRDTDSFNFYPALNPESLFELSDKAVLSHEDYLENDDIDEIDEHQHLNAPDSEEVDDIDPDDLLEWFRKQLDEDEKFDDAK